jgi:hypothetical protein
MRLKDKVAVSLGRLEELDIQSRNASSRRALQWSSTMRRGRQNRSASWLVPIEETVGPWRSWFGVGESGSRPQRAVFELWSSLHSATA